mmetsp:Transcript_42079/g.87928  ORF Transcript_42079/g.87928 Transcript_42079/m.87928 type:complete len:114 (-) Transcript_42079:38-379(-)
MVRAAQAYPRQNCLPFKKNSWSLCWLLLLSIRFDWNVVAEIEIEMSRVSVRTKCNCHRVYRRVQLLPDACAQEQPSEARKNSYDEFAKLNRTAREPKKHGRQEDNHKWSKQSC